MKAKHQLKIGVLGPHDCSREERALGLEVGAEIARQGAILICGGLGGIMKAAAEGAKGNKGLTVGILPGEKSSDANEFIDVALPTGFGPIRNALIVRESMLYVPGVISLTLLVGFDASRLVT